MASKTVQMSAKDKKQALIGICNNLNTYRGAIREKKAAGQELSSLESYMESFLLQDMETLNAVIWGVDVEVEAEG